MGSVVRIRVVVFSLILFGTVTAIVPYFILTTEPHSAAAALRNIGFLPIATGILLYSWCCRSFWIQGRGTPIPLDPPKILVVKGPYQIVRNPMFIAVFLVLIGEAILFQSRSLFFFTGGFCVIAELLVRLYEEPTLHRKFGKGYSVYCASVGRWFPQKVRNE